MSRIAKDLARSAPWHVHPRPSASSNDNDSRTVRSGRHSSSNFAAVSSAPTADDKSSSRSASPASYNTTASASTTPTSLSTSTSQPSPDMATPTRTPSVAIIGAGIASLRLASLLLRSLPAAVSHLTVFEARSRIGGRICQETVGGHHVDMGANWIHGVAGNPIMQLAERTGTTTVEPEESSDVFDEAGQRMPQDEAERLAGEVWEGVVEAFKFSDEHTDEIDVRTSLYDWFVDRFEKAVRDGRGAWSEGSEADKKKRLRDVLNETHMWGPFIGDAIERQSLKFFWMEECIDGGNVFVADTYSKILAAAAEPVLAAPGVLKLDSEVTRIEVLPADAGVQLTLHDGRQSVFDEVICTAPLGWLKAHKSSVFSPPLPPRVDHAIDSISYGRLEKLYVSFPRAFWLDPPQQTTANDPDNDENNDPNRPLALFTHFHHPSAPSYHPIVPPHEQPPTYNQNLVSLAHLPGPIAHPTLLFYVYGACATSLVASVSGLAQHDPRYRAALWDFARPFVARLPGFVEGEGDCEPVQEGGLLCTRWQDDKWAGSGSYANFQVGLSEGAEDVSAMREGGGLAKEDLQEVEREKLATTSVGTAAAAAAAPVPASAAGGEGNGRTMSQPRKGGLWLAGEHTAPVVALGTTTGAWWSGEGVARRICEKWGFEVVEDAAAPLPADDSTDKVKEQVLSEVLSGGGPGGLVQGEKARQLQTGEDSVSARSDGVAS